MDVVLAEALDDEEARVLAVNVEGARVVLVLLPERLQQRMVRLAVAIVSGRRHLEAIVYK